jgi:hypothetical protein
MAGNKATKGPAVYTMLWPRHVVDTLVNVVDGAPLRYVLGRSNAQTDFARFKITVGDTLVPLHIDKGKVCPIARMEVTYKGTVAGYQALAPAEVIEGVQHPAFTQILVGAHGTAQHFFRPMPTELLRQLRYDAAHGPRALTVDDDGRLLKHNGIDGVFRLTPECGDELAHLPWL